MMIVTSFFAIVKKANVGVDRKNRKRKREKQHKKKVRKSRKRVVKYNSKEIS